MKNPLPFLACMIVYVSTAGNTTKCDDRKCCVDFYEDRNGICVECPIGTFGLNCTASCPAQYYGRLCRSKCACPANQCDPKHGCKGNPGETETQVSSFNSDESTSQWMNVAFALIGSITTMGLIGLLIFLKSWFAKRETAQRETHNHLGGNQGNPVEDEHRYESNRSLSPSDEVEDVQPHPQADENNYTDLRFSCIYDNPLEGDGGSKVNTTLTNATVSLFGGNNLTSSEDESDDSSDEDEGEEKYEHLVDREAYNVLSLRRPCTSNIITVGAAPKLKENNEEAEETEDGYQPVLFTESKGGTKETGVRVETKSMSMKETCRQSLISETIQEYIEASNIKRNPSLPSYLNRQSGAKGHLDRSLPKFTRPYSVAKASWQTKTQPSERNHENIHQNTRLNVEEQDESDEESSASKKSDRDVECTQNAEGKAEDAELHQKSRHHEIPQTSENDGISHKSQNDEMPSNLSMTKSDRECPPSLVYTQVMKKRVESLGGDETETAIISSSKESTPSSEQTTSTTHNPLGEDKHCNYETCTPTAKKGTDVSDITYCLLCFLFFVSLPRVFQSKLDIMNIFGTYMICKTRFVVCIGINLSRQRVIDRFIVEGSLTCLYS